MKTDWEVGDQAYVWYPRKRANARDLKGSIVLVELIAPPGHERAAYYRTRWTALIKLSGFTTTWAKKGCIIYVLPDELHTDPMDIHKHLCTVYSQYLLDQVSHINNHWNEQYNTRQGR